MQLKNYCQRENIAFVLGIYIAILERSKYIHMHG